MNTELKTKWLAALRSGGFVQGRGYLRTLDDKYCCLGILCEVAGMEFQKDTIYYIQYVEGNSWYLPPSLDKEFSKELQGIAIQKNDVDKCDFNQIADWLETVL